MQGDPKATIATKMLQLQERMFKTTESVCEKQTKLHTKWEINIISDNEKSEFLFV